MAKFLVPDDLEFAFLCSDTPRTRNKLLERADVLQFSVDDVVHSLPTFVLYVRFEVYRPAGCCIRESFRWGDRQFLERCIVCSGIERTGRGLAVPVELEQHVILLALFQPPITAPRALQRKTILSHGWHYDCKTY